MFDFLEPIIEGVLNTCVNACFWGYIIIALLIALENIFPPIPSDSRQLLPTSGSAGHAFLPVGARRGGAKNVSFNRVFRLPASALAKSAGLCLN